MSRAERPGLRPMRALPQLEPRRGELEKCVFCPKLCRSACPVSNAEPRETVTPWGKMSLAWMAAHGDVPVDASHAAPAWACTGCGACREACDHHNPVGDVLLDARDALSRCGQAPAGAARVLAGFAEHDRATREATGALATGPGVDAGSGEALLLGCGYVKGAAREARDAIEAAAALSGSVALVDGCCGLPLRLAGDQAGFARHARRFADTLRGRERLTVVDPGCAVTLGRHYEAVGVRLEPRVELLVERAARSLSAMRQVPHDGGPVRWHDPCQLGRGLGIYEAPRAVLARALGRAAEELEDHHDRAACSGAGGLLPVTAPEVAGAIAQARLDAHARAGGGRIVTACASSLALLRARARGTDVAVDDLVTWMARGFGRPGAL